MADSRLCRLLSLLCALALVLLSVSGCGTKGQSTAEQETKVPETISRPQLNLWYTDEALTEYLEAAAFSYTEVDDEIRIQPVLVSGTEFINTLYNSSLEEENIPDLYLISNDFMEKAYLAGLAEPLPLPEIPEEELPVSSFAEPIPPKSFVNEETFPVAAVNAVTYNGRQMGYPFYFQTSAFLYNKSYLNETGESEPPKTIQAIEDFANEHDAPGGLESFFSWDVTDIFYNYFFVGGVIDLGGECGDDPEKIVLDDPAAVRALTLYQGLNQFFSIDSSEVSYDKVLQEFREGKLMFTVATTGAVAALAEAKERGELPYDYAFSVLPDIDEGVPSRSLSVTEALCVNGFGERKEKAHQFAEYLTTVYADSLYARTGKVPACRAAAAKIPGMEAFLEEYENSTPIPKMIETGALWVKLEIAFTRIWEGGSVEEEIRQLQGEMSE